MRGDFSRRTFEPERHFSGVLMQQGRVQLDADWNEQVEISRHRTEAETRDTLGPSGGPKEAAAFRLVVDPAELGPAERARLEQQGVLPLGAGDFLITAGRYYVDGALCENEQTIRLSAQADLPGVGPIGQAGTYLVYLDVWQRHLTALEDPSIREVALGGPDTTTRAKTVWQVKLLRVGDAGLQVGCSSELDIWDTLTAPKSGRLRARVRPAAPTDDASITPPAAGFRGLENRLYRVEIHDGGQPSLATFKWSRDNGSVATRWLDQQEDKLIVASSAHDGALGLAPGQILELTDDSHELAGEPGALARLERVEGQVLNVSPLGPNGPINRADFPLSSIVRRWDAPRLLDVKVPASENDWVPLEDGIEVAFEPGAYRPGDFWLIPARTATGDIEWPRDVAGQPLPRPPLGIDHHYCRLGFVTFDGNDLDILSDCRQLFAALSQSGLHVTAIHVGGQPTSPPLRAGMDVPIDTFLTQGLRIVCDGPVDPATISLATCYVTLDVPFPLSTTDKQFWGNVVLGFQPLVLAGTVATSGNTIAWTPTIQARQRLLDPTAGLFAAMAAANGGRVLARLSLKGSFIWSATDPASYLDGEAFGTPTGATPSNLRLPSGDGRRGGTLEVGFGLVPVEAPTAPRIAQFTITSAPPIVGGTSAQGRITLTAAAPTGGLPITLGSSSSNVASVPQTVTVTQGQTFVDVQITTFVVTSSTTVVLTASRPSGSAQVGLSVQPVGLTSISLTPPTVTGGASTNLTVTLNGPAPTGGLVIDLSAPSKAVTVPSAVTVLAPNASRTVSIPTNAVSAGVSFDITASRGAVERSATLTVAPATIQSLTLTDNEIVGGGLVKGRVTLSGKAPFGGLKVSLSSSLAATASVPAEVTVPQDGTFVEFNVTTKSVTVRRVVTITAADGKINRTTTLAVIPSLSGGVKPDPRLPL